MTLMTLRRLLGQRSKVDSSWTTGGISTKTYINTFHSWITNWLRLQCIGFKGQGNRNFFRLTVRCALTNSLSALVSKVK